MNIFIKILIGVLSIVLASFTDDIAFAMMSAASTIQFVLGIILLIVIIFVLIIIFKNLFKNKKSNEKG